MVLIRTVARYFEQALKCCFSSSSFGVLQRIDCIHLILGKAGSSLEELWQQESSSAIPSACARVGGSQCSALCGPSLPWEPCQSASQ